MHYMQFEFVLKTNSDDVDYETERANGLARRIYGTTNVTDFTLVQVLPENWNQGDPVPDPNENA